MEDACPICSAEVEADGRVGGPVEEAPNELQRELGVCRRGHPVTRWLDESGHPHGPWFPAQHSAQS
jgi:hypothetical protein